MCSVRTRLTCLAKTWPKTYGHRNRMDILGLVVLALYCLGAKRQNKPLWLVRLQRSPTTSGRRLVLNTFPFFIVMSIIGSSGESAGFRKMFK